MGAGDDIYLKSSEDGAGDESAWFHVLLDVGVRKLVGDVGLLWGTGDQSDDSDIVRRCCRFGESRGEEKYLKSVQNCRF